MGDSLFYLDNQKRYSQLDGKQVFVTQQKICRLIYKSDLAHAGLLSFPGTSYLPKSSLSSVHAALGHWDVVFAGLYCVHAKYVGAISPYHTNRIL